MRSARFASGLLLVAACGTPVKHADPPRDAPPDRPAVQEQVSGRDGPELRATVRIDPRPGGKMFQGVWLELEGGRRWLIDYRPREVWLSFEDQAVRVTGHCYMPYGQAMGATHFEVLRMHFAQPSRRSTPLLAVGPEVVLRGAFDDVAHPPGSKLAGSTDTVFRTAEGKQYWIFGTIPRREEGSVKIWARTVEWNPAHAAAPDGDRIWIVEVRPADQPDDPPEPEPPVPCPG
jgi:hypothetical protein